VSRTGNPRDEATREGAAIEREPASFRDPASTVYYSDGRVLRGLGEQAAAQWQALAATRFFRQLLEQGKVCRTEPAVASAGGDRWALVLEHERIPFVSYPYEWTFSMLRDAALLHLDILLAALDEGVTMKDGYAYNVQWRGTAPVFIDVVSFERLRGGSQWSDYQQTSTYTDEERAAKSAFVADALAGHRHGLVCDLGCNDGTYTRVAAGHADYVVAVDADDYVVDGLYRRLRDEGERRILPLVMNLTDPSPGIGWRGRERAPFFDRARPDAVLCLALVHHLALTSNVPLPEVVDWLRAFDAQVVVEFVDPADPMAKRLLANMPPGLHDAYQRDTFERLLGECFTVQRRVELPSGTRMLYAAVPRG
jgi:SAM-dependent methyltransferase